jgi:LPXTG-motif cell wall-anchored protein
LKWGIKQIYFDATNDTAYKLITAKVRQGENTMNSKIGWVRVGLLLAVGAICMAFAVHGNAQVKTTTSTASGQTSYEVNVARGEVVRVDGRDLLVKMDDGTIRHFPNVSESVKVMVDGQPLGIHDLKPGMKLERTITTSTTPKTITTVKTVTGKVWSVNPPSTVILTLEDGKNQQFTIPKDQKFTVDGQQTDAFGLKKGMKVSATKIVEVPVTESEEHRRLTGSMPPPPPAPPANEPMLIAAAVPEPTPAADAPAALPKTGSQIPLIGMLGGILLLSSLGLRVIRHSL